MLVAKHVPSARNVRSGRLNPASKLQDVSSPSFAMRESRDHTLRHVTRGSNPGLDLKCSLFSDADLIFPI